METRSNRLLVICVVSALVMMLLVFILWLRAASHSEGGTYLIRFQGSVAGLEKGSPVTYAGVPVGRVQEIGFDKNNPALVVVTITVEPKTPVVSGVEASLVRSLMSGTANVSLEGGKRGAEPIIPRNGNTYPVIPAKEGGLLAAGDPADLISKISRSADKISRNLEPLEQRRLADQLAKLAQSSADWPRRAVSISEDVAGARGGLSAARKSSQDLNSDAARLRLRLERAQGTEMDSIKQSLQTAEQRLHSAREGAEKLDAKVQTLRPAIQNANEGQRVLVEQVRSVRATVQRIGDAAERIDKEGVAAALGTPAVPDYRRSPTGSLSPGSESDRAVPPDERRRGFEQQR